MSTIKNSVVEDPAVGSLWQQLMNLQTDLSLPAEIPYYVRSPHWKKARSVVDLGTGNGYYLGWLADVFPDKQYTGIDIDARNIDEARRRERSRYSSHRPDIEFILSDLHDVSGSYDVAIARLCIQHIHSLEIFAERVKELLSADGSLFVIESIDTDRVFLPELPSMKAFFEALRANRKEDGRDRDAGQLFRSVAESAGLDADESMVATTSSEAPHAKERFVKTYLTAFRVVNDDLGMAFDHETLEEDLRRWAATPGSYTHLSASITRYGTRRT